MSVRLAGVRRTLGRLRRRVEGAAAAQRGKRLRRELLHAPAAERGTSKVSYGRLRLPADDDPVHGGLVKVLDLARVFPNEPLTFNVLYLVSSALTDDAEAFVAAARARGGSFVWNQNGIAYPAVSSDYERTNKRRASLLRSADRVVFQSEFCRTSAAEWYGSSDVPGEVLYNPVDTTAFVPRLRAETEGGGIVLLLGGNQYERYRFETALATLARLPESISLLVTGDLSWHADRRRSRSEGRDLVARLGLERRVELAARYRRAEAPALVARGDVLLHTKVMDPCPTTVLEALACALPVVYAASGGVPELVGTDAGIGVPSPLDWRHERPPDPDALAEAVLAVLARRDEYAAAARSRAVERFDLQRWLQRHRELFERLAA